MPNAWALIAAGKAIDEKAGLSKDDDSSKDNGKVDGCKYHSSPEPSPKENKDAG